jgi:hypothetical protein
VLREGLGVVDLFAADVTLHGFRPPERVM